MASSFHIENFGCRAARADGEAVAALLRKEGATDSHPATADIVIVNTCSVTAEADREARAWIRRANRLNPAARIIVTGCYAQRAPEELAAFPGVAAVIGNSHKALTPEIAIQLVAKSTGFSPYVEPLIESGASTPEGNTDHLVTVTELLASASNPLILADDTFAHSFLEEAPIVPGVQTRPNLKIQEGCSNRCSFCVIPQTRGNSRSLPSDQVFRHIRHFVDAGGNELVLSGINLGRWGRDLKDTNSGAYGSDSSVHGAGFSGKGTEFGVKGTGFSPYIADSQEDRALAPDGAHPRTLASLVRVIFEQTDLPRLRLSSIEPMDWDADLIALMREFGGRRLARHAHLPLQSGSDSVLRRMHRRYRPWHYAEKIARLREAAGPELTVGADVMVGFPGETDREFQESCDFIRSLPFGYLHLFPFSARPGTRAWALHTESPVPDAVIEERMAALRDLAAEKTRAHRAQFIDTELDAITLHTPAALAAINRTSAITENFLPVELTGSFSANQLLRIRITGISSENTLLASPVDSGTPATQTHSETFARITEPILENAF